jgi:uncharacterized Fe-S radical SAM superfamily protein PflX
MKIYARQTADGKKNRNNSGLKLPEKISRFILEQSIICPSSCRTHRLRHAAGLCGGKDKFAAWHTSFAA